MADDTKPQDESTYPEISAPVFKSDIPAVLLAQSSDEAKFIMEQLSVTKQFIDWSVNVQMLTHAAVRRTNGRLIRVESWKAMFTSWYVLAAGIFAAIGAVAGVIEVLHFVAELLSK